MIESFLIIQISGYCIVSCFSSPAETARFLSVRRKCEFKAAHQITDDAVVYQLARANDVIENRD